MKKFLKNYLNYTVIGSLAILLTIVGAIGGLKGTTLSLLEQSVIAIILAVSLNMVVGFLGELSLGHAGFMCVGAYVGGKIAVLLSGSLGGTNIVTVLLALVVGGLCAGLCGFIVGLPALRLRGDYLAIVTLDRKSVV